MTRLKTITCVAMASIFAMPLAFAQDQVPVEQQPAATTAQPGSEECFQALAQFSQRLHEEQFWVTGWGTRFGAPGAMGDPADPALMAEPADPGMMAAPWAGIEGGTVLQSPRTQIRELYGAAQVLAYRGETDGCEYLISILNNTYEQYVTQLSEAGVAPETITGWRQEQIALARPVSEMQQGGRLNLDDLTGTDVRNLQDESLGSISDLIIDSQTAQITHAVVARGGFLGLGEDYIAVPWERFRATPGLNTLILDVSGETLDQAPSIEGDAWGNAMIQQNEQIDQFWSQM